MLRFLYFLISLFIFKLFCTKIDSKKKGWLGKGCQQRGTESSCKADPLPKFSLDEKHKCWKLKKTYLLLKRITFFECVKHSENWIRLRRKWSSLNFTAVLFSHMLFLGQKLLTVQVFCSISVSISWPLRQQLPLPCTK